MGSARSPITTAAAVTADGARVATASDRGTVTIFFREHVRRRARAQRPRSNRARHELEAHCRNRIHARRRSRRVRAAEKRTDGRDDSPRAVRSPSPSPSPLKSPSRSRLRLGLRSRLRRELRRDSARAEDVAERALHLRLRGRKRGARELYETRGARTLQPFERRGAVLRRAVLEHAEQKISAASGVSTLASARSVPPRASKDATTRARSARADRTRAET